MDTFIKCHPYKQSSLVKVALRPGGGAGDESDFIMHNLSFQTK